MTVAFVDLAFPCTAGVLRPSTDQTRTEQLGIRYRLGETIRLLRWLADVSSAMRPWHAARRNVAIGKRISSLMAVIPVPMPPVGCIAWGKEASCAAPSYAEATAVRFAAYHGANLASCVKGVALISKYQWLLRPGSKNKHPSPYTGMEARASSSTTFLDLFTASHFRRRDGIASQHMHVESQA